MVDVETKSQRRTRAALEAATSLLALLLLVWAWRADDFWFELHATAYRCARAPELLRVGSALRVGAVIVSLTLFFWLRPKLKRRLLRQPTSAAALMRVGLAVFLALFASEVILRKPWIGPAPPGPPCFVCPPIGPHERYGWLPAPLTEYTWHGPRDVLYVTDEHANRTASLHPPFDPLAPTILVGGESISEGIAVRYEETFASLIEHDLSVQVIDTGVVAYTMDQAYLRELDAVSSLPHLLAIITTFVPEQVERPEMDSLSSLQPDQNDEMTVVPAAPGWLRASKLRTMWRGLYHSDHEIDHMRFVARLTAKLARSHGAYPLFLTTNYLDRCLDVDGRPPALFQLLFDDQKIPRVHVDLPSSQRAEGDTHPGPLSHRQMATAIELALHEAHVL